VFRVVLSALVCCSPALAQSSAVTKHPHHHAVHSAVQPAPVVAARTTLPAPAVGPAPVPNEGVTAPMPTQAGDPTVAPSVFALHYPPQGEGYVTGSSPQAMDDRNAAKVTGVQMTLPLTQGSEPAPP